MAEQTDDLLVTCKRTFGSLDAAVLDGNDSVLLDAAEQTAIKIGELDAGLVGTPIELLEPIIRAWLSARRIALGLRA